MRFATVLATTCAIFILEMPAEAAKRPKFKDECATISKTLREAEGSSNRLIVGRSVLGGLLGAGVGLLAADKDKKAEGVLAGAAVGAGLGAATAYLEKKQRENADRKALAGSVYSDIAQSNAEAARALRAFVDVRECRVNAANTIKAAVAAGTLETAVATDYLARHRELLEKDIAAAERYTANFGGAMEQYRSAADFLASGNKNDELYIAQRLGADAPVDAMPVPVVAKSRTKMNVREGSSTNTPIIGSLAKDEAVEMIGEAEANGWQRIRTGSGASGFVLHKNLIVPPKPKAPKVELAQVSQEVRSVSQPLFEGVEKRRELDAEVQVAKASVGDQTFELG